VSEPNGAHGSLRDQSIEGYGSRVFPVSAPTLQDRFGGVFGVVLYKDEGLVGEQPGNSLYVSEDAAEIGRAISRNTQEDSSFVLHQ
jgi:hypothetical protein